MTEAEAKTKWCPQVQYAVAVGPAGDEIVENNRSQPNHNSTMCIGSACMAWRWEREEVGDNPRMTRRSQADGFCGLAGKP